MFEQTHAFSGFSTNDVDAAKKFYGETLGIKYKDTMGGITLEFPGSNGVFVYPKDNHEPATYTVLNFPVGDIDKAVAELKAKGVEFEHYDGMTDDDGVAHATDPTDGPSIAWFKDPAGNILSVLQN
jgi:predicted enzyme related to lactoylglutathione lyase